MNAYSEIRNSHEVLVLNVVRYERMFDRDRRGPGDTAPTLDRWTINLTTGAVTSERRDDRSQEFPRINETLLGSRHRFGYTVGIGGGFVDSGRSKSLSALYKHDYADRVEHDCSARPRAADRRDVVRPAPRRRVGPACLRTTEF